MKKVILFLIISFLISSCEYFSIMSKKDWEEKAGKENDVVIYVGGVYISGDAIPCFWKIKDDNIERIELPYESEMSNAVTSIYVVGDNVYTSGYIELPVTGQRKACYWINKKRYDLDTSLSNTDTESIYVKNGVVMIAGSDGTEACYWINQNQYILNIKTASSIFLQQISSSKHVTYIGGQNLKSPGQACFWKDGNIIDLPPLPTFAGESSEVFSIYVNGNFVYSVGILDIGGTQNACLWKNIEPTILTDSVDATAYSVFILNEDVYIAGVTSGGDACYWKNNKYNQLTSGSGSLGYSIFAYNDNAYTTGYELGFACYWINNKHYSIEESNNSYGTGIFVTADNEK